MDMLLYLLLPGGLLVFLSQASYARDKIIIYGYRDKETPPHLCSMQKMTDMILCRHYAAHSLCALLMIAVAIGLLRPEAGIPVLWLCVCAWAVLASDAVSYLVSERRYRLKNRIYEIKRKWKGEKVFGPEHDSEVSLYRSLKEITTRNLVRNIAHSFVFAALTIVYLIDGKSSV